MFKQKWHSQVEITTVARTVPGSTLRHSAFFGVEQSENLHIGILFQVFNRGHRLGVFQVLGQAKEFRIQNFYVIFAHVFLLFFQLQVQSTTKQKLHISETKETSPFFHLGISSIVQLALLLL